MTDFLNQILDPIFTRMVQRLRITRTEVLDKVLGQNRQVQAHLDKALPELERSLGSRPDLLRLIMEVYSYLQDEGEELSATVVELREARKAADRAARLLNDSQIDVASIETYLNAIKYYIQFEPQTISYLLAMFETDPALGQEKSPFLAALDAVPDDRFLVLETEFEKSKKARGW